MLATPSFIPLSTLVPTCKDYVKVKKGNISDTLLMTVHTVCMYFGRAKSAREQNSAWNLQIKVLPEASFCRFSSHLIQIFSF